MKKKTLIAVSAMTLVFGCSMTVCASPEVMPDGTVFDAEYYAQAYPDVAAALGTSPEVLYQHYVNFGKSEGRLAAATAEMTTTIANTKKAYPKQRKEYGRLFGSSVENTYYEYGYDANNNIIREVGYFSNGDIDFKYEYEYDMNNNLTKKITFNGQAAPNIRLVGQDPNDINNWTMYEYDANNNLIKETSYYSDGSFKNRYEYKYDSNGNKISGALYSWDYDYLNVQYKYEYDVLGNLVKETMISPSRNAINGWSEYEYDASGNMIKKIDFFRDGSIEQWEQNEYDASGNKIKLSVFEGDGRLLLCYEYLY